MKNTLTEYKINIYKDQFSQVTRTVRRNLLIVSSIVILLTIKGININPTFGLDFSSNIAKGAVAIVVIYELVTFIIYSIIDYRSWSAEKNKGIIIFKEKTIDNYLSNLEPLGHPIPHLPVFMDPENPGKEDFQIAFDEQLGQFENLILEIKNHIANYSSEIQTLSNSIKQTNYIQIFRIITIDWFIPISLACFALYRSQAYISEFFKALL